MQRKPASASTWRLALAVLLLSAPAPSCRCSATQKQPPPGLSDEPIPPETPMTAVEDDARKELRSFLDDPKLDVSADEAQRLAPAARQALEATFAELDPRLRSRIDASRPVTCARNGCFKDVVYADWATYYLVNQAVLFGRQQSPFARYPGAQYRSGRSPEDGGRFVVTWALMFPLRGGAK